LTSSFKESHYNQISLVTAVFKRVHLVGLGEERKADDVFQRKFLPTMLYTIAGFVMHCRTVPWSFFIEMLFQWCILFV